MQSFFLQSHLETDGAAKMMDREITVKFIQRMLIKIKPWSCDALCGYGNRFIAYATNRGVEGGQINAGMLGSVGTLNRHGDTKPS
jgi:hypothetical protein